MAQDHWLPGFNFNVEERLASAAFAAAVAEKPAARFMIRSRTRVVQRHPKGDW